MIPRDLKERPGDDLAAEFERLLERAMDLDRQGHFDLSEYLRDEAGRIRAELDRRSA